MMKNTLVRLFGILFLFSPVTGAFESAPSIIFVSSTYSGHEEITRQALNYISRRFNETGSSSGLFDLEDLKFDLLPEAKGLFGYKSKNMVIHGNFSSDFPRQTKVFSLADFWKIKNFSDFENPQTQVLHFLKNYKNSVTLESARTTCYRSRSAIKHVTLAALSAWEAGEKTKALFLIGHATHTIQDSFSPAHTRRAGVERNYDLINICYYGVEMNKKMDHSRMGPKDLCYHNTPDSRDAVWNLSPEQYKSALKNWTAEAATQCDKGDDYPETEAAKASCLSNEARLARLATEKYLFVVFGQLSAQNFVKEPAEELVASLDGRLFDGPVGDAELDRMLGNGILRCDALPDNEIFGYEPIGPGS